MLIWQIKGDMVVSLSAASRSPILQLVVVEVTGWKEADVGVHAVLH